MTDFDDILGEPKKKIGRPKGSKDTSVRASRRPSRPLILNKPPVSEQPALSDVMGGVTIAWLTKAFRMSRASVVEALKDCPIQKEHKSQTYYDLRTAAGYLIDPVRDMTEALANIDPKSLPERYREGFWNAKIKELKYKVLAGELWPTESVMEVLGDSFELIDGKTKVWVDELEEIEPLPAKLREGLLKQVDTLRSELRATMIERAESKVSESYVAELDS